MFNKKKGKKWEVGPDGLPGGGLSSLRLRQRVIGIARVSTVVHALEIFFLGHTSLAVGTVGPHVLWVDEMFPDLTFTPLSFGVAIGTVGTPGEL